jgi:hypothetical protein
VVLWPESCFDPSTGSGQAELSMTTVEAFPRHPELVLGSIPNLIQETELFYELQNQILKQVQDDD